MDPSRRNPLRRKLFTYLNTKIREDYLFDAELLGLTFATGIGDGTTYSEYRVFTANHTGNTVLLAVGVAENTSGNVSVSNTIIPSKLIVVSLSMFLLSSLISGQLGNRFGPWKRWWILLNNFFQVLLVFTASIVQAIHLGWGFVPRNPLLDYSAEAMIAVALLAFSSGSQVALVRLLHRSEITTANATSCYVDLLIDKRLLQLKNRSRNRRLFFLAFFWLGSFAGGFAYQRFGSSKTLFVSAVGKTVVTIMIFFNKAESSTKEPFSSKGDLIESEECSDSDLTFANRTDKEGLNRVSVQYTSNLTEKPTYTEFDYRGTQSSTMFDRRRSREANSRYSIGNIFDLSDMQVYLQIPSWNITAGGYRRIPEA